MAEQVAAKDVGPLRKAFASVLGFGQILPGVTPLQFSMEPKLPQKEIPIERMLLGVSC